MFEKTHAHKYTQNESKNFTEYFPHYREVTVICSIQLTESYYYPLMGHDQFENPRTYLIHLPIHHIIYDKVTLYT